MSNVHNSTSVALSVSAAAARNLATATVTVPQTVQITPRWLLRLLPYVHVDGGVYRVNQVAKAEKGQLANEYGERQVELLTSEGGSAEGGEPLLPTTFVDYKKSPREYHLNTVQTVLHTHTRVTDLYSNKIDQLREQIRLTVEAVKEREEWELLNNADFGLLKEIAPEQSINARSGAPTPDDLDELLALVWKKPAFFLAHPKAIAAFGRECTRRGVPPPTVQIFGSPFLTWRGVPLIPSNKLDIKAESKGGPETTSIILLRVGEADQGVVGLQKAGVTGELEPGLSVRYMSTNEHSIASHLVTRYFSVAVLTQDAIARLDNVHVDSYHKYVYPKA
ncbi:MAG: family 2A encapsulin nanocompartment shell protein [Verrucomicrobiota bacterium]